jgi:hypothetical protein
MLRAQLGLSIMFDCPPFNTLVLEFTPTFLNIAKMRLCDLHKHGYPACSRITHISLDQLYKFISGNRMPPSGKSINFYKLYFQQNNADNQHQPNDLNINTGNQHQNAINHFDPIIADNVDSVPALDGETNPDTSGLSLIDSMYDPFALVRQNGRHNLSQESIARDSSSDFSNNSGLMDGIGILNDSTTYSSHPENYSLLTLDDISLAEDMDSFAELNNTNEEQN